MRTRAPIATLAALTATSALAACGGDGDDSEREVVTAPGSFYERTLSDPVAQGVTFEGGELIDGYRKFGISLRAAEGGPGFQTLAPILNPDPGASADVDLLFDLPASVAAEAENGGALAVVSSPIESWYTGNSTVAGRLALTD